MSSTGPTNWVKEANLSISTVDVIEVFNAIFSGEDIPLVIIGVEGTSSVRVRPLAATCFDWNNHILVHFGRESEL